MCNRDPAITAYSDSTICFACERRQKWGSARLSSGCIFAMSFEQSFTLSNFPLLTAESLARAGPGYRSSAQLCLPASVRLFIPGCTCVFVGMWRVAKLHKGMWVWVCGVQVHFVALYVWLHLKTPPAPLSHITPPSLSAAISLPRRLFQSIRLIKWARSTAEHYFYQKAIFRRCPQVSGSQPPQTIEPWQGVSPRH